MLAAATNMNMRVLKRSECSPRRASCRAKRQNLGLNSFAFGANQPKLANVPFISTNSEDAFCEIQLSYHDNYSDREAANVCPVRAENTRVKAAGYDLLLDGKPFVIKGMNYSPVPIGAAPRYIPYGDYFIPYYANVWKLDLDKMREAGINVIKLHADNPDLNASAPGSAGNWKNFLDYCWNGGNSPVYVVMMSYTQGNVIAQGGKGFNDYLKQYRELVKSTFKHPAIFGYMIGNEIFDEVTQNP